MWVCTNSQSNPPDRSAKITNISWSFRSANVTFSSARCKPWFLDPFVNIFGKKKEKSEKLIWKTLEWPLLTIILLQLRKNPWDNLTIILWGCQRGLKSSFEEKGVRTPQLPLYFAHCAHRCPQCLQYHPAQPDFQWWYFCFDGHIKSVQSRTCLSSMKDWSKCEQRSIFGATDFARPNSLPCF